MNVCASINSLRIPLLLLQWPVVSYFHFTYFSRVISQRFFQKTMFSSAFQVIIHGSHHYHVHMSSTYAHFVNSHPIGVLLVSLRFDSFASCSATFKIHAQASSSQRVRAVCKGYESRVDFMGKWTTTFPTGTLLWKESSGWNLNLFM